MTRYTNQSQLLQDIHERVIRIEEHIGDYKEKIEKHEVKINKLEERIIPLTSWEKIKTVGLTFLSALLGSSITFIFTRIVLK